jgi:prepilin-type N-terminal cleavage/methylation domain-containing protein
MIYPMTRIDRQSGFTLIEIAIVIGVVAIMALTVVQFGHVVTTGGKVTTLTKQLQQITAASLNWNSAHYNYNGISFSTLEGQKLLPPGFSAAGNPFGGGFTLTGNGSSFTITADGIPDSATCLQIMDKISRDTLTAPSCPGNVLTTTFGG